MANLALPQLFVKSSNSFFESTISTEEIINFHLSNKHKYAILTESQEISHFPVFHHKACQKNLIPVLSLHYVWKNISEWLLIPKNFEGYHSLLEFTMGNSLEESKWENIVKIFISGEKDIKPWKSKDFFIANSESERGVFIRENIFLKQEDYSIWSLVRAIKTQSLYSKELELNSHLKNSYLIQEDSDNKIWRKNLVSILRQCEQYSLIGAQVKEVEIKEREEIINYCQKKLKKLIINLQPNLSQKYLERFQREIDLFDIKNYWNYCFIFYELMQFINREKILTSAGRGSACSSLIIFLIGITQVDPIKYDLLFDRFLNDSSERIPDLDLDVDSGRKLEILDFLEKRFEKDRFVIPSIIKCFKNVNILTPILKKVLTLKERENTFLINRLIGLPFISQPHPSSLIILPKNMKTDYLSARKEANFNFFLSPFDYSIISYLGLQKFDLLSSPYLAFMTSLLKRIKEIKSQDIQLMDIPLDNVKTYALIGKSLTYGLFHLDSLVIKKTIADFKPQSIDELAQLISIIRPGINKHIFKFLNHSKFPTKIELDESIQKIIEPTRGIILYQEQIMQLISSYINISLSESDKYRIALQKQKFEELEALKLEFFSRAYRLGKKQIQIERIWSFINSFGAYSFNKSHAIAYALSAYQSAYLKANFKEVFYLEVLKKEGYSDDILFEIISLGYKISIPEKLQNWTLQGSFLQDQKIFFLGLSLLKTNSELLFNKLQTIKSKISNNNNKDFRSILFILLSNGFNKEDIMDLNYLNSFRNYFSDNLCSLYLRKQWDYFYEKLIYDFDSNQLEEISFTQGEKNEFEIERQKRINISWKKFKLS